MTIRRLVLAAAVAVALPAFAEADAPALWKKHCKGCHGEAGKAETKKGKEYQVDDITTAEWQDKHDDAKIKSVITEGMPKDSKHKFKDKMKSFKDKLSGEEIDALVKFIRTLKA